MQSLTSARQPSSKAEAIRMLVLLPFTNRTKPWVAKPVNANHSDKVKKFIKTTFKEAIATAWESLARPLTPIAG